MENQDLKQFLESMIEDIEWIDGKVKPLAHEYIDRLNVKLKPFGLKYKIRDSYPLSISVEILQDSIKD